MTFQDLHLSEPLLRAVEEKGYTTPTPIQARAIEPALAGRDLLGCAQTGTGKTAAFTLPILQQLDAAPRTRGRRTIRALVLTPTRELAIQIDECCRDYARHTDLKHTVIFGGVNQRPQVEALERGVDILIATPGRLLDLAGQGHISLEGVRHFVLDEADRMLDMGFIHDIRRILPLLPERKQTLFFSATMPPSIAQLAASLLHDPVRVTVTPPASVVETIDQQVCFVAKPEKIKRLVALLGSSDAESVLLFSRTKHGADRIARQLTKAGISCRAIHGDKSQSAREKALNGFKTGGCRVLVATDIAARGIDITQLPLVVNYDLPEVPETYVHRIGRTGRAGCDGRAYSFCAEEEIPLLRDIEKTIGRRIPVDAGAERPEWAPADPPEFPAPRREQRPKQPRAAKPGAPAKPAQAAAQASPAKPGKPEKTAKSVKPAKPAAPAVQAKPVSRPQSEKQPAPEPQSASAPSRRRRRRKASPRTAERPAEAKQSAEIKRPAEAKQPAGKNSDAARPAAEKASRPAAKQPARPAAEKPARPAAKRSARKPHGAPSSGQRSASGQQPVSGRHSAARSFWGWLPWNRGK